MDRRSIGVFDSGVGGLTAVRELRRCLPNEDIIYFGDTGRVPYGTRSQKTILGYTKEDIHFLLTHDVKAIVVACGTASSVLRKEDLESFGIPVVTVVGPSSHQAVAVTRNHRIGVIGTTATIHSGVFEKILRCDSPESMVYVRDCPLFVPLVENSYLDPMDGVVRRVVADYLAFFNETDIDTLILGCTHYPLLAKAIQNYMGQQVALVDSGKETALATKKMLEKFQLKNESGRHGRVRYFVSDGVEQFTQIASVFLEEQIGGLVEQVRLPE